ncbi:hypothetical protein ACFSL6_05815 [Paenibacillus thailandensis]|uniref:Uncharacterized protein n=1 Tax=Paenibacillus thailandensis TaxID=393250 RepID=A0ABW5QTY6_9BACL
MKKKRKAIRAKVETVSRRKAARRLPPGAKRQPRREPENGSSQYNAGYNAGFAAGFEAGHQKAYEEEGL